MTENTGFFSIPKKPKVKLLSKEFIYAKLLLIYAFLYTLAFSLGCFLFHALDAENSTAINARLNAFFDVDFSATSWFDRANLLIDISSSDISHLIIILTAGFTMFAGIAISMLLIFRGFSFGFSVSYFAFAINNNIVTFENAYTLIIFFSVISAISAAIMIHFGVKTTCFSDEFKALGGIPRKIIKSKALYSHFVRFLIAFGAILILNLLRCFF